MAAWRSEEWLAAAGPLEGLAPAGWSGTFQVTVTGGVEGETRCHLVIDGGRVVGGAEGSADAPDVTFTITGSDAGAVRNGQLDPTVAFMQGRLKTAGDPGAVLALLGAWSSPAGRRARARLAELAAEWGG